MIFKAKNSELETILKKMNTAVEEKINLPVGVSYKIVKNRLAIEQALAAYRMTRDKIVYKYSGDKGYVNSKDEPEIFREVCREIDVIAEEYSEVDISKISVSELGERELPLDLVSALGFMME